MSKTKIIDQLFSENVVDKTKDQSYKDTLFLWLMASNRLI